MLPEYSCQLALLTPNVMLSYLNYYLVLLTFIVMLLLQTKSCQLVLLILIFVMQLVLLTVHPCYVAYIQLSATLLSTVPTQKIGKFVLEICSLQMLNFWPGTESSALQADIFCNRKGVALLAQKLSPYVGSKKSYLGVYLCYQAYTKLYITITVSQIL